MDTKYSEKEIVIFQGLISLIKSGKSPYSITVSEIAQAADIGKGTIYDYFKSKEEVIRKTILYWRNKEIEDIYLGLKSKTSFKEKYLEILNKITKIIEENSSLLSVFISSGGAKELHGYLEKNKNDLCEHKLKIDELLLSILETGFNEGVIKRIGTPYYQLMVISSSIMGFYQYIGKRDSDYKETTMEMAMVDSYKLLIKGLN